MRKSACIVLVIGCMLASPPSGVEAEQHNFRASNSCKPSFLERIEAGRAFQGCNFELQGFLTEIGQLAAEYICLQGADLVDVPGEREEAQEAHTNRFQVTYRRLDGTKQVFMLSSDRSSIDSVAVNRVNGQTLKVIFGTYYTADLHPYRSVSQGVITMAGSERRHTFSFDNEARVRGYYTVVGGAWSDTLVEGRTIMWDDKGDAVVECHVPEPTKLTEVNRKILASLNLDQLARLGVSAQNQLTLSHAFDQCPRELQRTLENVVGWSDRLHGAGPDDLMHLVDGLELTEIDHVDEIEYQVRTMGGKLWKFRYDAGSRMLKTACLDDVVSIYLDHDGTGRCIGGRGAYKDSSRADAQTQAYHWLFSIYSESMAPRVAMCIATEGNGTMQAVGPVYVWDKSGEALFRASIAAPEPLARVISQISLTLTSDQVTAVGWRGEDEIKYLQGRH